MRAVEVTGGVVILAAIFGGLTLFAHRQLDMSWRELLKMWLFVATGTGLIMLASVLISGGWS